MVVGGLRVTKAGLPFFDVRIAAVDESRGRRKWKRRERRWDEKETTKGH